MRKSILHLFEILDNKAIGDKEFTRIIRLSSKSWERIKDLEKQEIIHRNFLKDSLIERKKSSKLSHEKHLKRNRELYHKGQKSTLSEDDMQIRDVELSKEEEKDFNRRIKKIPQVPIYTTCIRVLMRILHSLKNHELKNKIESYGPLAKENAKKYGAWHEALPNIQERPKPGDIILSTSTDWRVRQKEKKLTGLEYRLEATKKKSNWNLDFKKKSIDTLNKNIIKTKKELEKIKDKIQIEGMKSDKFIFKHIGFLVKIEKEKDNKGNFTGKEYWHTFDGGQTVKGYRGGGSKKVRRTFYPQTLKLVHPQVPRKPSILKGWVDVDKIMKPKNT